MSFGEDFTLKTLWELLGWSVVIKRTKAEPAQAKEQGKEPKK